MNLFRFSKSVIQEFGRNKGGQLSAALAYTGLFALAPLLLLIISLAGFFFGQRAAEGRLFSNLADIVGPTTANTLQHAISNISHSRHGALAFTFGLVGTLLTAGALTSQLQNNLDTVFDVVPDPKGGARQFIYVKLKNVAVLIIGSLIMIASVVATVLLTAAGSSISNHLGMPNQTLQLINILASFLIFVVILFLIYRVLPDVRIPSRIVWGAALIVGIMFLIGKLVLGWIIGKNSTVSAYGAAASLVTLLLWIYYSSQILLIGAAGMKVYGDSRELEYRSKRYANNRANIRPTTRSFSGRLLQKFVHGFKKASR